MKPLALHILQEYCSLSIYSKHICHTLANQCIIHVQNVAIMQLIFSLQLAYHVVTNFYSYSCPIANHIGYPGHILDQNHYAQLPTTIGLTIHHNSTCNPEPKPPLP